MHRAEIAGRRVAELVEGRDREAESSARRGAVAGAVTVKCVAAAALTLMLALVPVMEPVTVSVAVIVWPPAVISVAAS